MWVDLHAEIASLFELLEGCGMPGRYREPGDERNSGFSIWDPERKNAEAREARKDPRFAARRKAKGRRGEYAAATAYRKRNRARLAETARARRLKKKKQLTVC